MKPHEQLAQDKSPYARVDAPCPYFGTCGGCSLQDLAYPDQLELKRRRLLRALEPLGPLPEVRVTGLEEPWRYRNKAEFTFGTGPDGQLTLGYHAARSFWKVVGLDDCLLLPEPVGPILRSVRELTRATGLPAYHPRTHQGAFRYLTFRASRATGQVLLVLVTASGHRDAVERIARELTARHPEIRSVYWGGSDRLADVAVPETLERLSGEERFEERIGPFHLLVHPMNFLQPAGVQADRMYAAMSEAVGGVTQGTVWDLYCGIGLVGFYLAGKVRKVYGIDVEPHHLAQAAENAARNGITNIEFRTGKVEDLLADKRFWLAEGKPDAVVVDPPRAGLHASAASSILAARPKHIAYLSCHAPSLVRDLQLLGASFPRYRVASLRAFDMFPQTPHVETFALLERVN